MRGYFVTATGTEVGKTVAAGVVAQATVHGYITAFRWSAAIFAVGAVLTALVLRFGKPALEPAGPPAEEPRPGVSVPSTGG